MQDGGPSSGKQQRKRRGELWSWLWSGLWSGTVSPSHEYVKLHLDLLCFWWWLLFCKKLRTCQNQGCRFSVIFRFFPLFLAGSVLYFLLFHLSLSQHVDFQLFLQKSSGIPVECFLSSSQFSQLNDQAGFIPALSPPPRHHCPNT